MICSASDFSSSGLSGAISSPTRSPFTRTVAGRPTLGDLISTRLLGSAAGTGGADGDETGAAGPAPPPSPAAGRVPPGPGPTPACWPPAFDPCPTLVTRIDDQLPNSPRRTSIAPN